jgi:TetR/AcrR family transcriptional regulator, ethionamide resistance regulator
MDDLEVGELWGELMDRFVTATAEHLRREQAAGRLRALDPDGTAESLVLMMERCNYVYLGLGHRDSAHVVETLTAIWFHALYPDA